MEGEIQLLQLRINMLKNKWAVVSTVEIPTIKNTNTPQIHFHK